MAGLEEGDTAGEEKEAQRLIVGERAKNEFHEIYNWLEDAEAGLGEKFFKAYESALRRIKQSPKLYPRIYRTIRIAPVPPFRYRVFYIETSSAIKIVGLIHTSRNIGLLKSRFK